MTVEIRKVMVDEVWGSPEIDRIMVEYAAESKISELPTPLPDVDTFRKMEAAGVVHIFASYADGSLTGFLALLTIISPRYNKLIATAESYFVLSEHRKGGTGKRLLDAAEDFAKDLGAIALFVSAPVGGRLEKVMPIFGYRETNRTFFRSLV